MTRIELVIDEVVWHGGKPGDRRAFGAELERALARELRDPGLISALGRGDKRISSIDAGRVPHVGGDTVARAVARGLASATRSKP
ncbi:MAG TPA: hypothetical protein VFQ65_04520 [Kofleriaceae bacterium]|nr:hypothetical protein [Kofleriaceae bacterium]